MHQPGIEPGAPAWQAGILPLNHWYAKHYTPIWWTAVMNENVTLIAQAIV